MKTKHTPGPLEIVESGLPNRFNITKHHTPIIAVFWGCGEYYNMGKDEAEANAKLITVAPEMLKALEDCQKMLQEYDKALVTSTNTTTSLHNVHLKITPVLHRLNSAIKKATQCDE